MDLVIPPRAPDWHDRHAGPVRADIGGTVVEVDFDATAAGVRPLTVAEQG